MAFGVAVDPKIPVWLSVGVALDVLLGLAALEALAADVELLAIAPVVPPSDPPELVDVAADALVPKPPTPVLLVVDGAVRALAVIDALVGRVSEVDGPAPPPPPPVVVLAVELAADVTTPALVTLALGEVT